MTREEIEKFSDEEPYCFGYCVGCIDGLKAADAEPNLESLWHDASEEPKDNFAQILYQDKFGTCRVTVKHDIVVMVGVEWEDYAEVKITRWAYVKDLLPKGGEK